MEEEPEESFASDDADFLPARIDNISVSNLGFIIFLKAKSGGDGDGRVLPIFIGSNEAQSIAIAFNNQVPPRPLTHDLLKNILGLLDCEITKIHVTSLSENTFYARVYLRKEGIEDMDIDARPSDAIALAIRFQAPIFVHKDVYDSAAILVNEAKDGDTTETKPASDMDSNPEADVAEPQPSVSAASAGAKPASSAPIHPVEKLQRDLRNALAEERYEEAARLRDALKKLESGN